jgi:uncharacterized protein with ATP-grasp and redox domains
MIANESCWNCCLTTALRRAKALPVPPEKTEEMLAEIRRAADGCRGSESAPAMSAILTNVMKMYADVDDQYVEPKRRFNELMLNLEKRIADEVMADEDPLKRAVQYAMAGNYIDFGALDVVTEDKLMEILAGSSKIALDSKTLDRLKNDLTSKKKLVYITDNCGEIVMDKMKNLDPVAYVRFASVYREFKDVNTFMDELKSVLRKEADGTITDATDKSTPLLKEQ